MNKRHILSAILIITSIQGCSFTNRKYEQTIENNDYIKTTSTLNINEEYIARTGELVLESTRITKLDNIINCPRRIEYKDGITKYAILPGKYRILGSIEVQPGLKLPFIRGGYQESAIGGAQGLSLYYPINKNGSIYSSYYTDAFFNLSNGDTVGELKEWGGNATASDTCDYITPTPSDINSCTVYYLGATRVNGLLAPTLAIDDLQGKNKKQISAGNSYTFCGTTIKVNEATNILHYTATRILSNQP
jgi:hypothetical protein